MNEPLINTTDSSTRAEIRQPLSATDTSSTKAHINPKLLTSVDQLNLQASNSSANTANVYINPNFLTSASSADIDPHSYHSNVAVQTKNSSPITASYGSIIQPHINPNFINKQTSSHNQTSLPNENISGKGNVHINPNFVGRVLPPPPSSSMPVCNLVYNNKQMNETSHILVDKTKYQDIGGSSSRPHINPNFLDTVKTKAYDQAIKKAVKDADFLNKKSGLDSNSAKPISKCTLMQEPAATSIKGNTIYFNPKFKQGNDSSDTPKHVQKDLPEMGSNVSTKCSFTVQSCGKENEASSTEGKPISSNSTKVKISAKATPTAISSSSGKKSGVNKRTLFKMIGTRKLVRMSGTLNTSKNLNALHTPVCSSHTSKNVGSLHTPISLPWQSKPNTTTSVGTFKKIGSRKLIRKLSPSCKQSSSASKSKRTPPTTSLRTVASAQIYCVKTNKKIIKVPATPVTSYKSGETPLKRKFYNKRFMFSTPIAAKFSHQKLNAGVRKKRIGTPSPSAATPTGIPTLKRKTPFSLALNPFRIDRRKNNLKRRLSTTTPNNSRPGHGVASPKSKRYKINNNIARKNYSPKQQTSWASISSGKQCSSHKTTQSENENTCQKTIPPPPKPARRFANLTTTATNFTSSVANNKFNSEPQQGTLIQVHGVRYSVSENGRKLKRLQQTGANAEVTKVTNKESKFKTNSEHVTSHQETLNSNVNSLETESANEPTQSLHKKKFYLEGEEYVEDEPGILVRSRNSMTRASITNYKARSINTILKSQSRAKQYCMFYNKFGKCNKKDKGVCPYIHDQEKVAVCRKFLHGNCYKENCLLSHNVAPEKMPSCKFFLEGLCTKGDTCPYRHVKVNVNAEMCKEYQKGFCPNGSDCKKRHEDVPSSKPLSSLPESVATTSCNVSIYNKKIPPAKPKRKSLSSTCAPKKQIIMPKKLASRYYEDRSSMSYDNQLDEQLEFRKQSENVVVTNTDNITFDYEAKRSRLLRKVELAKKIWTQTVSQESGEDFVSQTFDSKHVLQSPNDSGPYEEIEEDTVSEISKVNDFRPEGTNMFQRPPLGKLPSYISLTDFNEDIVDTEELSGERNSTAQITEPTTNQETGDIVLPPEENYDERLI